MEWLQLILSLIGVIGLILVAFYYLKKYNKRSMTVSGGRLRIIDKIVVGRDTVLAVVDICGKLVLIGISSTNISKICDLDITERDYLNLQKNNHNGSPISFSEILSNITKFSGKNKASDLKSGEEGETREIDESDNKAE